MKLPLPYVVALLLASLCSSQNAVTAAPIDVVMRGSQTVQVDGGSAVLSPGYAAHRAAQQEKGTEEKLQAGSLYIMDDELTTIAEQNKLDTKDEEATIMALLEKVEPGTLEVSASQNTLANMPPPKGKGGGGISQKDLFNRRLNPHCYGWSSTDCAWKAHLSDHHWTETMFTAVDSIDPGNWEESEDEWNAAHSWDIPLNTLYGNHNAACHFTHRRRALKLNRRVYDWNDGKWEYQINSYGGNTNFIERDTRLICVSTGHLDT